MEDEMERREVTRVSSVRSNRNNGRESSGDRGGKCDDLALPPSWVLYKARELCQTGGYVPPLAGRCVATETDKSRNHWQSKRETLNIADGAPRELFTRQIMQIRARISTKPFLFLKSN